jgi:peptide/nickel transport system substrate-binding protein
VAPAPTVAPAAASQKKIVRIAVAEGGGAKDTMDPAFATSDGDAARIAAVYNQLVGLDHSLKAVPQLAESWSANDKADTWTFKLRKGVKWHDGKPFTAKDVVYTYKRLLDPKVGSPAASALSAIDMNAISAVDDTTVQFKLPRPFGDLPSSMNVFQTWMVPEGSTSDFLKTKAIGTGPFKLAQFSPGDPHSTFEKNPDFWGGAPKVDGLDLRSITESSTRNAALQSGQVDLAYDINLATIAALKQTPNVQILSVDAPAWVGIAVWCDTAPFDKVQVRQAMKYVMDRKRLQQIVMLGQGAVANDDPAAPFVAYGYSGPAREQDIGKAKSLLAEAGYGDGLEFDLQTGEAGYGMIPLATAYKEMAGQAGIKVNLVQNPADSFWDDIWLKKPAITTFWAGKSTDVAMFIMFHSKAKWNETHWYRPEFDKLIEDARAEIDDKKRADLYLQAQMLLIDEGGALVPTFKPVVDAARTSLTGYQPHPAANNHDYSKIDLAT